MHQLLNTLYVQTPRSYLHLDHETLKVKLEGETRLQVPLLHLGAVFCFGDVTVSTALLHRCAADGRSVVLYPDPGADAQQIAAAFRAAGLRNVRAY